MTEELELLHDLSEEAALMPSRIKISEDIERVLITGDLSKLTSAQRLEYYRHVCESVGLNPLTKPFDYLTLNNKLVLYANKNATEQLRRVHKISVFKVERDKTEDTYAVTAYGKDATGREDAALGVVTTTGLKGDALANAMMKAETKAKRRLTLSLCGLGMLDETEVETIPGAYKVDVKELPPEPDPQAPPILDPNVKWLDLMKGYAKSLGKQYWSILGGHGYEKASEVKDRKVQAAILKDMEAALADLKFEETEVP